MPPPRNFIWEPPTHMKATPPFAFIGPCIASNHFPVQCPNFILLMLWSRFNIKFCLSIDRRRNCIMGCSFLFIVKLVSTLHYRGIIQRPHVWWHPGWWLWLHVKRLDWVLMKPNAWGWVVDFGRLTIAWIQDEPPLQQLYLHITPPLGWQKYFKNRHLVQFLWGTNLKCLVF